MTKTTVDLTTLRVTGSLPGPDSTLPSLRPLRALPAIEAEGADDAMQQRLRYGRLTHSLPYGRQSDYRRDDEELELPAVVLSNGVLTATVLPTLGGRVWSLFDHRRGRELLFVNPRLRFANLALTDAWFAGGIEWNLGSTGHTTLTSRPMHAAQIETATGPGLRLWQWERTRDLVLQIDLALEDDRLLASTRVINPDPEPKPLYYWTNIAVPESAGTRVLAPADQAWRTDYAGTISKVPVPFPDDSGVDLSFPSRSTRAVDYFFDCPPPARFVASIEADGRGMVHTSTEELRGRKLFLWGTGAGGDRWQEWLSGPNTRYAEIQAGWCPTQFEHDQIPGCTDVSWTEAFGPVEVPLAATRIDYHEATDRVACAVARVTPVAKLLTWHHRWRREHADQVPTVSLWTGDGWGAVESMLRGDPNVAGTGVPFPAVVDSSVVGRALVNHDVGLLRANAGQQVPPVSPRWRQVLAQSLWDSEPWVRYARAVAAHAAGDSATAQAEYAEAISIGGEIAGAERGVALVAAERGDVVEAMSRYAAACALAPQERTLWTERVEFLVDSGRFAEALAALESAPESVRGHGRHRLLAGFALVGLGRRDEAAEVLLHLTVPDLAEGSGAVHQLWDLVHPEVPVPRRLDFRMG